MKNNIEDLFISPHASMIDAIRIIDKGGAQIALVVDESKKLIGILADGDIRRALLKGKDLSISVENIMIKDFTFITTQDNEKEAIEKMRTHTLRQIPVLNNEGKAIKILLLQELLIKPKLNNTVVIMAGGEGKRLRPITENCPKPMLKVGNKPMLEIILEQCIKSGISNFYISVNYLKEKIISYFGDGSELGIKIEYLEEDFPLGTAGSLSLIREKLKDPVIVINGDVLTRTNLNKLLDFHRNKDADATLCVQQHEFKFPYGVVQVDGINLNSFEEKPSYINLINTGIYVINPKLIANIPQNKYMDMPSLLIKSRAAQSKVIVYPIHEYWIDVGRPESLKKVNSDWDDL